MNIFALSNDVREAAKWHLDKHIVKMPLETAQLLCTALLETKSVDTTPYKMTHLNHPCSKWARASKANYQWLCSLGIELCTEYTYRYNKRHKCQDVIEWAQSQQLNVDKQDMTPFAQAMPDDFKKEDGVEAYRSYYIGAKSHIASWKNRTKPEWWEK
jgi:Pyrimidine dimer DNA glycosylase